MHISLKCFLILKSIYKTRPADNSTSISSEFMNPKKHKWFIDDKSFILFSLFIRHIFKGMNTRHFAHNILSWIIWNLANEIEMQRKSNVTETC